MYDPKSGIGYITYLNQKRKAIQACNAERANQPTLHERIETWYNGLSDDEKRRAWAMHEFKALFGDTAQKIGAALFYLRWTRRRSWQDSRPTSRYWIKEKDIA
jgi:hypothetical protein